MVIFATARYMNNSQFRAVADPGQFFRCGTHLARRGSNRPRFKNYPVSATLPAWLTHRLVNHLAITTYGATSCLSGDGAMRLGSTANMRGVVTESVVAEPTAIS